jgi:SanA protein
LSARLLLVGLSILLVAVILCGGFLVGVRWQFDPFIYAEAAATPSEPVALVFGGGIYADGSLSPMLQDRVDTAVQLYKAGKVRKLLVSGDNRFLEYDEPGRMYDYAVAHGVPAGDVIRDYAGRRTYDTCYRAGAIFGVHKAVLVTQRFHLYRAMYTCASLGLDVVGLTADRRPYGNEPYYWLRDAVAILAAWFDVTVLHPEPVLGDKIDIGL